LKTLYLFTQKFPYIGGETFLEGELPYLAKAFERVLIYPREYGQDYYAALPTNVSVMKPIATPGSLRIRSLVATHWKWILGWVVAELWHAPHRFQFIRDFRFQWNRMLGLVKESVGLKQELLEQAEGIYYSYWFNEWATLLAMCREQGLKGKMVARMHGYDFDEKQNGRGYFPFRRSELAAFDAVHQISEYGLRHVQDQFPGYTRFYLNRLGVSDNGMANCGKETEPYRLVSCSNFVALKRIPLLIETLSLMKIPFIWVHFGSGAGMEEAKALAARLLPEGSYHFKGFVPNQQVLQYYREQPVDAFINMSELEGIPVSLMEAIASGIPVIGCNVCGVPEIVGEETGLLLPADVNAEGATGLISQFLKEKTRNTAFRKQVKSGYEKCFSGDDNYPKFIASIAPETLK
jgi:glycosyltransferase involved in cell wall biosynthesis